jgi:predicted O-methyltransferase YrrM
MSNNYKFTVDWFSFNIPVWTKYLDHIKNKPDLMFLEIGSFEGRSATWLLENILTNKTSKIVCVDTFDGSVEHIDDPELNKLLPTLYDTFCHNISSFADQVIIKRGKSQDILKHIDQLFDFIYIDGDHTAVAVLEDAVLSFALLKPGGILIFDDYMWGVDLADKTKRNPNIPKNAIDVFLMIYADKLDILYIDNQAIISKKPE